MNYHVRMEKHAKNEGYLVKKMKWIIFPDNPWIKKWDVLILTQLVLLVFILPYEIGVSIGYYLVHNIPWLVFTFFMNALFVVDTFLYFFRAYRTREGRMVFNFRSIRKRYMRTYFCLNLISNFPSTLIFYLWTSANNVQETSEEFEEREKLYLVIIKVIDIFKLARFARLGAILRSSNVITDVQQNLQNHTMQLVKFSFIIVCVSHWFACFLCALAYIEARTFGTDHLEHTTWITLWYEGNYVEGGLNPVGWERSFDRYVLSLFWSIQTITSIGYGNISPVTPLEWWFSCILMLLAAIMWANVIGGLIGVTTAMFVRQQNHRVRVDQANRLIKRFKQMDQLGENEISHDNNTDRLSERIMRYINSQNQISYNSKFATTLPQLYPVLMTLSPELQHLSALFIFKKYLEAVPYLSSRYLSTEEQSHLALQCCFMEFGAREQHNMEEGLGDHGRGVFVFQHGCALALVGSRCAMDNRFADLCGRHLWLNAGSVFGQGKVLLEDGHPATRAKLTFLSFTKVVFIPRNAILDILKVNQRAWKESARWIMLRALLRDQDWTNIDDVKRK